MKTYTVTRSVPKKECPWLDRDIEVGEKVYEYLGCTYGCISSGQAVSFEPGKTPFFEIPRNALT